MIKLNQNELVTLLQLIIAPLDKIKATFNLSDEMMYVLVSTARNWYRPKEK